jgi:suppressor for copper-sensitivity B
MVSRSKRRHILCGWAGAIVLGAALLAPLAARAEGAASPWFETDQGRVRLIAAAAAVGNDAAVQLGLEFRLAPHWKIYWRSPGDAGYPPHLDWSGSRNLAGAEMTWPAPERFSVFGLETIGYSGAVVLPITARLEHAGAALTLRAALDYLTCSEICIPYQTSLSLDLPAGAAPAAGLGYASLIAQYAALVPGDGSAAGLNLAGATLLSGEAPVLELRVDSDRPLVRPDAFVEMPAEVAFGAPVATRGSNPRETVLRLPASGDTAALLGRPMTVTLVDGARAMAATIVPEAGQRASDLSLLLPMVALALLGGLILNAMPCVLPVLSLKLLGAITHGGQPRTTVRRGFLATAAGIVLSFLVLALATIGLKAAGIAVGWGVQFQQPLFLTFMVALLTLFAGNLWGLFEVPLPRVVAAIGERRAVLGNVATGAFATLLATPCSAPFLGTALGFALAAGPVEIVGIFLALGLGMAAPYLLVAATPRLAALLPRPGHWMVSLRRILGGLLAVSALWLLWVLRAEIGLAGAFAVAVLMAASIAAHLLRAPKLRGSVLAGTLLGALLVAAFAAPLRGKPRIDAFWRPFDPAAIAELVRDGRVVFVDVTADWCLTCKVNERLVLDAASVRRRLAPPGVVAMRADWTRPSDTIALYLRRFGRYGIPFNVVYGPGAPAGLPLPEILTPDTVTTALGEAARAPASIGDAEPRIGG